MSRWEPGARGRLEQAAIELFAELGFERVTVAEIAERAGLTERTFYRHFADKREVLFPDANPLNECFAAALDRIPEGAAPMAAVAGVLEDVAAFFDDRHAYSSRRQAVVAASAELRERELVKIAGLTAALAAGLRRRGVPETAASLAADAAMAVFKLAVAEWAAADGERRLRDYMGDALAELRAVMAEQPNGRPAAQGVRSKSA